MEKKILKVDAKTHKKIKVQASENNLTINDYVRYLSEFHLISPTTQLKNHLEAFEMKKDEMQKSGKCVKETEAYLKGIRASIVIIKGHEEFSMSVMMGVIK